MESENWHLRQMSEHIAGKWFCADKRQGIVCFGKSTYYLVYVRPNGSTSLYRRCAECACEDAKRLGIAMPKGGA